MNEVVGLHTQESREISKVKMDQDKSQLIKHFTNSVRNACLLRPSSAVNAASSTRERYATALDNRRQMVT